MRIAKSGIAVAATLLAIACSPGSRPAQNGTAAPPQRPPFLIMATIQDLMAAEIDPAADFIWGSVGTVVTQAGSEDRHPKTDEQWKEVRRKAIVLIEATNLLVMPGRRVALQAFPSDGPGVLSSAEIERRIQDDRAGFNGFAFALREVGLNVLHAVDKRDVAALSEAGEAMDGVCEACHVANWYPHQVIPELPDFKSAR